MTDDHAGLADFLAGWRTHLQQATDVSNAGLKVLVTVAVIGLTNFAEHPVESTRLAELLGRSVSEAVIGPRSGRGRFGTRTRRPGLGRGP